ncbi:aminopeptidase [Coemansia sp. RSA 552]|nr:aminopeptidase [Coemansia sp. RSA 552]
MTARAARLGGAGLGCLAGAGHSRRAAPAAGRMPPLPRCLHTSGARRRSSSSILSTLLQTAKHKDPVTAQWYGQATHAINPELVAKDETTPGISREEYEERRRQLVDSLPDGSVVFVFSARMYFVSPHVFHEFRQDSDFYYLTGWNEPDSVAVIEKTHHAERGYTMTMFVRPKDPEKEVWEGPRSGIEAAVTMFGADEARPVSEFGRYATRAVHAARDQEPRSDWAFYTDLDGEGGLVRSEQCNELHQILKRERVGSRIRRLSTRVQRLRLTKSPAEIRLMREANRASGMAFAEIMRKCRPGLSESTLQSVFEHASKLALLDKSHGAGAVDRSVLARPAYVPVFASGEHALCMHYVLNMGPMKDGDLILVDAGAEYAAYASDITRTFPVNGQFSAPQRDLYSALLNVQTQMIKLCHASSGYSLNEIHRCSTSVLASELKQIGFRASQRDIEDHLFPHHISHYLGMDVHDTMDMTRSQQLKPNMVVTVEPGIYVPHSDKYPKAFRGIGIRIEDDVVVGQTENDSENLSVHAPKSVEDIEACMGH